MCIATSGPGATNFVTGIADAKMDSTPILCITGQVASPMLGTDAFQETDIVSVATPLAKWAYQITDPEEIPRIISKALYIARSGRPGPVLIDITKDAQASMLDYQPCEVSYLRGYSPSPPLDLGSVDDAVRLIDQSRKPLALVGQGVLLSSASAELAAFVEKSGVPFAETLLGLSALPRGHPLCVGMLGMHGNYGPNIKTNECDLVIAIGMRFDDRVTGDLSRYAKQAKVIHIEIDPAEVGKNVKPDVAIVADAREALGALSKRVKTVVRDEWLAEFRVYDEIEHERVTRKLIDPSLPGLRMADVMIALSEKSRGEAIIVADVGQHQMAAGRYYRFASGGRMITSGGAGTMGYAVPAALGAAIGRPGCPVVAVVGDGGFQMTMQELGAIAESQAPVKLLILNNEYLGMVRQWQEMFFSSRYSSTELLNPDFAAIAAAYGIENQRVSDRGELGSALEAMLESESAYLLDVAVEREENVFPMIPPGASVSDILLE